jgi:signal transduction histidine kinase
MSKLFMDFNKLDENVSMNRHGVGLGLSISKKLIEQMGGNVRVESAIGLGSTFTINFKSSCIIS